MSDKELLKEIKAVMAKQYKSKGNVDKEIIREKLINEYKINPSYIRTTHEDYLYISVSWGKASPLFSSNF